MADALMLCPEAPYPVIGGGPTRTACVLEYLAGKYTLDVITFREPGCADPLKAFPRHLARSVKVIDLPHHGRKSHERAWRNLRRLARGVPPLVDRFGGFDLGIDREYEVAVIEHFWCAPYIHRLRPRCRRIALDLHNIESVLLARCAGQESGAGRWALQRFSGACRDLETELLPAFDLLLVTSEVDRAAIGRGAVMPNAIPLVPKPQAAKRAEIVFSGNMAYLPNTVAAHWFARNVWPTLRAQHTSLNWRLVGKNPEALRLPVDPRIEITGPVEDAVTALSTALAGVVPILSGSGTRFKILEAWAAGVPVISTPMGAEGLDCRDGEHLLLAGTAETFAAAVSSVLNDCLLAQRLADSGRSIYEQKYTWPIAWKMLEEAGL
jgi:polysaccharide biosynthesis protein PslH